jgi:hypothetical protein
MDSMKTHLHWQAATIEGRGRIMKVRLDEMKENASKRKRIHEIEEEHKSSDVEKREGMPVKKAKKNGGARSENEDSEMAPPDETDKTVRGEGNEDIMHGIKRLSVG